MAQNLRKKEKHINFLRPFRSNVYFVIYLYMYSLHVQNTKNAI